ncbi:MAG: SH3 domain-containing protein [Clostridia bacterium]|nr:SH3 domain-containing protein [Clostridia bacterium]
MKRMFGIILAAMLLLLAMPIPALADGPELKVTGAGTFVQDGSAHTVTAAVENAGEDSYEITYAVNGGSFSAEAPSKTEVGAYTIEVKAVNTTNPEAATLTKTVTLTITPAPSLNAVGGTFAYDGSAHAVSASVSNGEGYAIEYSTDNGSTWVSDAPGFTAVGTYPVKVRATKGEEKLEAAATITIQPVLKATGVKTAHDGKDHSVTAEVLGATGYSIEYSIDGGKTWTTTAPTRKDVGKTTVSLRALKSGAETLTAGPVEIEIVAGPTLTAKGGTFVQDGKSHKVEASVTGAEGYTIEYSIDGGKTWTTTAPERKDVGKDTVKVRATKSGEQTLTTADVTLEVTAKTMATLTIVNCNTAVNVRKSASKSSTKLGTAKKGKVYQLLGTEGKWYKIQYTSTQVGYVHSDYGKVGETTVEPEPAGDRIVTIANCVTDCNVRSGGDTSYAKIGVAPLGKKYTYLGKVGNYYKIQYTATQVGYVHQKYAKVSSGTTSPDPEPSIDGKIVVIVNCNTAVNVRSGGSKSAKLIGTAPRSKQYTYLGTSGDYVKIQYREKTVGYVHKSYAKVTDGTATPDPEPISDGKTGTIYNCKTAVNVRAEASSDSKLLGTIQKGVTVTILGTYGSWTKIQYGTGTAYVFSKYVKSN